jgi:hypothetical protein
MIETIDLNWREDVAVFPYISGKRNRRYCGSWRTQPTQACGAFDFRMTGSATW